MTTAATAASRYVFLGVDVGTGSARAGCRIILPRESESVLLGAAILGAVGAKKYSSLREAMKALNAPGQIIYPSKDPRVKKYHDAKYGIFRQLYEQQLTQRAIMAEALS